MYAERLSFERELQDLELREFYAGQRNVAERAVPLSTAPKDWFLTEAEINAARGRGEGVGRNLAVFSSKNLVVPLVDGEDMMRALRDDLIGTKRGDFVHFAGWRMDSGQNLMPGKTAGGKDTVLNLWSSAISYAISRKVFRRYLKEKPYRVAASLESTIAIALIFWFHQRVVDAWRVACELAEEKYSELKAPENLIDFYRLLASAPESGIFILYFLILARTTWLRPAKKGSTILLNKIKNSLKYDLK